MKSKSKRAKKKTTVKKSTPKKSTKKKAKSSKSQKKKINKSELCQAINPEGSRFKSKIGLKDIEKIRELVALHRHKNGYKEPSYSDSFVPIVRAHMADGKDLGDFAKLVDVHYNTVTIWAGERRAFFDAIVEGQLEFIDSLGPRLIDHMMSGHSFESFGGIVNKSRQWLYDLAREDPMFAKAKEVGTTRSMVMWEQLLKAQSSGTLQRVKETVPVLDGDGNPKMDENGNAVERRIYAPTMGSDRSLQFAMRARFKYYRPEDGQSDQTVKDELAGALAALDEEEKNSK